MLTPILRTIGAIYIFNALTMWFAPMWWYETVPGLMMMGPFNLHFVRDIGLVYLVSGFELFYGARVPQVAIFASLWPALHALFHAWIFVQREMPIDLVAATKLFQIQLPAWLSLWCATKSFATLKSTTHPRDQNYAPVFYINLPSDSPESWRRKRMHVSR